METCKRSESAFPRICAISKPVLKWSSRIAGRGMCPSRPSDRHVPGAFGVSQNP
jgi:hypothetical protein